MKLSKTFVVTFTAIGFFVGGCAMFPFPHLTGAFAQEAALMIEKPRTFETSIGMACKPPVFTARLTALREEGTKEAEAAADALIAFHQAEKPECVEFGGLVNIREGSLEPNREIEAICNPLTDPQPCRFTPIEFELSVDANPLIEEQKAQLHEQVVACTREIALREKIPPIEDKIRKVVDYCLSLKNWALETVAEQGLIDGKRIDSRFKNVTRKNKTKKEKSATPFVRATP